MARVEEKERPNCSLLQFAERERGRDAKGESCSFCSFHLDIGIVGGTAALDSPAATPTPLGTSPRLPIPYHKPPKHPTTQPPTTPFDASR